MPEVLPSPSRLRWPVVAALLAVCAVYLGTFLLVHGYRLAARPDGYYPELTEALLSGQTYLEDVPDPRLAQLANPYDSYQGIPRRHDATYYHGRYYVYFGVAPVLLLLAPVRLLTGAYLSDEAASLTFAFVGFLLGLAVARHWLSLMRVRPGDGALALGVLTWGLGSYVFIVTLDTEFYGVPIECACLCLMAALYAMMRACRAAGSGRVAGWMAGASLAWGAAVASRPHYVLGLPLLALPFVWLAARESSSARRGRLAAATLGPAALVGALLAGYNYARFGSVTEFGFHYQFTAGDQRFIQMWNPRLILPNLREYLLHDGVHTIYFPWVSPSGPTQGALAYSPFAVLGLLFPLTLLSRRLRANPAWVCVGGCALAAGLIHVLALSVLPIGVERYDVDFTPEFVLAGCASALALFAASADWRPAWRKLSRAGVVLLAAISIAKCAALAAPRLPDAGLVRRLGVICNYPVAVVQELLGGVHGPVKLYLSFTGLRPGERHALIATGGGKDCLFVERVDARQMRLGFFHLGNTPVFGPPIPLGGPGEHTLIADLGSLYPPDTHRVFFGWNRDLVDALQRRILVTVDGKLAFSGNSRFYPTDPAHVAIGTAVPPSPGLVDFPGPIFRISHLRIPSEQQFSQEGWHGDVRLHFRFPAFSFTRSEPLLSTGSTADSDMIYVTYLGHGRARFGHDSRNGSSEETAAVTFNPDVEHTLDVGLGSLEAAPGTAPADEPGLRLAFDGEVLIRMKRRSHPSEAYQVVFGYNAGRMSTAQESFSGELRPEHLVFPAARDPAAGRGPLDVTFRLAPMPAGISEPLVVSGVTGRGDIVYIHYLDARHAYLGIDHWGIGEVHSAPFDLFLDSPYRLSVSSATFLPPEGDPLWETTPVAVQRRELDAIRIRLDGREVLVAPWRGYPSAPAAISVARNPIGGSTTTATFTGRVLEFHRGTMSEVRPSPGKGR